MKKIYVAAAACLALVACASPAPSPSPRADGNVGSPDASQAVVFAAASLNAVFPEITPAAYSFDGSSGLVDQLKGGAPADVFASADKKSMDAAVAAGVIDGAPVMFATNYLVLVTPPDNAAGVTGLDASLDGVKLVVCAPEVPCGTATAKLAERLGVTLAPVSEESKVTDVLGKVTSGEADAGLVYATDSAGAGAAVASIDIPGAADDPNTYWVAKVADAPHPESAQAFIDLVTGAEGEKTLAAYGFGKAR